MIMKLLITAGPTREPIDPVRFISNPSSGKMGYALAAAAKRRGHSVTLVSGPVAIEPPRGVRVVRVMTALEMLSAVRENISNCDALAMAAAVSDFRPASYCRAKIKKAAMSKVIRLKPNPDILRQISGKKGKKIFVGFAAETDDFKAEPLRKLRSKRLDLIVANNVGRPGSGFETDTNKVTFYFPDGKSLPLPLMSKRSVAERIIARIEKSLTSSVLCIK